ncbi:MAG: peptide chain release factor 3 [Spirochaetales bacterium]|nr:peptide chain release factor 3 [Spirochaetales bacterium]MCF7938938.1 peptide chain release factor 3 [Spirochaetales bacterium]
MHEEIARRRTFAIISHPDAGKTTLTEKLLLFGGGIRAAGAVKSNKITRTTTSDFMEIEKQRGISVSTAVMTFEYDGKLINILDTPGHKDFSEDTYRTLSAVDSVILVVDSVKGVEEQTERLMQVCRMRKTPVMIFVNKLDREGKQAFELADELEEKLEIAVRPLTWPIGSGSSFKGVYNLHEQNINLFRSGKDVIEDEEDRLYIDSLEDERLDQRLGSGLSARLREEVDLIEGVYDPFQTEDYLEARVAPLFFGSALNNFGVRELLDSFVGISPAPGKRGTATREVAPEETSFSGFIFKIHANLDPNHRDRIAFLRVCSGRFQKDRQFRHVRLGKTIRFNMLYGFMARKKNTIDEAYPGDVIGLYDRGDLKIGDTLTEKEDLQFEGIPNFSPEIFREVVVTDPMRSKQLNKGLTHLIEEGLAQLFIQDKGRRKIVGTVGELQFQVIQYRLENEYGASCSFRPLPYVRACWITSESKSAMDEFMQYHFRQIAYDLEDNPVYFAESDWMLRSKMEGNPEIRFHFSSELDSEMSQYELGAMHSGRK